MTAARRGIGLSCALALVGCAWSDAPTPEAVDACARDQAPLEGGVVGRDGAGRLSIDGVAVLPRGVGSYPLLEHAGNGRMEAVHDVFDQATALGRPVVRTNAYLDGGRNPARIREADGALRDEGLLGLDRLLAAAAERGVRLVLILTNNDADTLVRWARTMAEALRGAGATQLVAWGGSGHLGRYGEDLERIAADGAVDLLTLHVYPFAHHALRLDASTPAQRTTLGIWLGTDAIRERAALARRHRLPLIVEELGWRGAKGADRDGERALVLGAWLRVAREEGVAAFPWMIGERGRPDYDGLLIRPEEDPATVEALRCE